MHLQHIMAAADAGEAGRHAVRVAMDLATMSSARLTVLRVVPPLRAQQHGGCVGTATWEGREDEPAKQQLREWLDQDVLRPSDRCRVHLGVSFGIPGVEIGRFAESHFADLVVLGRKPQAGMTRLLLGETAGAVARRGHVPTLFVPHTVRELSSVLVALDGSARGMTVLLHAADFARHVGGSLSIVSVDEGISDDHGDHPVTSSRSLALQQRVSELFRGSDFRQVHAAVQRGDIVENVIGHSSVAKFHVLATGYHRGAVTGGLASGSAAQRLGHAAHCAVLTIPL
jgi:nucleotide-binding universal stress UspA family protein